MRFLLLPLLLLAQDRAAGLEPEWGSEGLRSLRYGGQDRLADRKLDVEGAKGTSVLSAKSIPGPSASSTRRTAPSKSGVRNSSRP